MGRRYGFGIGLCRCARRQGLSDTPLPVKHLRLGAGSVCDGDLPTFVLALIALTIAGLASGIDDVTANTILQEQVPDVFLGRVFAVRFLSYGVGEALAFTVGGLVVDAVGQRSTYIYAGGATAEPTSRR